jgi:hypothetical protein
MQILEEKGRNLRELQRNARNILTLSAKRIQTLCCAISLKGSVFLKHPSPEDLPNSLIINKMVTTPDPWASPQLSHYKQNGHNP